MSRKSFIVAVACAAVLVPAAPAAAETQACPATALAAQALTGFEHGRRGFHVSTVMAQGSGVSYDATARTGAYALKVAANKSNSYGWFMWSEKPVPTSATVRFALRLDQLPSANVTQLFGMDTYESPRSTLRLGYDASSQRLKLTHRSAYTNSTSTIVGGQVEAGQWYVVDLKWNTSTALQTAEWALDGATQGTTTVRSYRTEALYNVYLGTNAYDTFTARYDDLVMTGTSADYPIGDGGVHALRPNATPSASSQMRDDDGTAVDASSWQRLDDANALQATDFVKQVTASSSASARIEFADTDASCIRAVRGYGWTHDQGKGTNTARLVISDGVRETLVKDGNWSGAGSRDYSALVVPPGGWTAEAVNGLFSRFGFSTDVSPAPLLDGVMLEYEAAPEPQPEPAATEPVATEPVAEPAPETTSTP